MALSQSWKKRILSIHQIFGLVTGIAVVLIALTGACWAFKEEIEAYTEPSRKVIVDQNIAIVTATEALDIAKAVFPDRHVHGTIFGSSDEVIEIVFYDAEPEFYTSVYVDPYRREVVGTKNHLNGFFAFILRGHMYLWLPKGIGGFVVKYSILIFLFVIFSGLLLWIPKNGKRAIKQRITFDWKSTTKWRRKNFDLHSVVGFYSYIFAFTFAFTGSIISFPWFYYIVFLVCGGSHNPRFVVPDNITDADIAISSQDVRPIDKLVPMLQEQYPNGSTYELHYPGSDTSSIYVEIQNVEGVYYDNDYRFYDQYSLEEIPANSIYSSYDNADFSDMVIRMNYDIHIGAIGGFFGKLLAFFASIIIATLPITGIVLFFGRRKRNTVRRAEKLEALRQAS